MLVYQRVHYTIYITHDIYYMIASNLMFRLVQKLAVPVPPAKHEIKVCPMCWYPKFWGEPVYTTPIWQDMASVTRTLGQL